MPLWNVKWKTLNHRRQNVQMASLQWVPIKHNGNCVLNKNKLLQISVSPVTLLLSVLNAQLRTYRKGTRNAKLFVVSSISRYKCGHKVKFFKIV